MLSTILDSSLGIMQRPSGPPSCWFLLVGQFFPQPKSRTTSPRRQNFHQVAKTDAIAAAKAKSSPESQVAQLQSKIAKWQASRDKLNRLLEQLQRDKATTLEKLDQLGVSAAKDAASNPRVQVLSDELKDILRQTALYEKKYQEYDLAILKSEARVRSIARQLSAREAGVSDAELEDLTRSMIALDESLSADKDLKLPFDPKDTVQAEMARYREGKKTPPTDAKAVSAPVADKTPLPSPASTKPPFLLICP